MSHKGVKQQTLGNALNVIFPDKKIITNARKEGHLTTPTSGEYLEIDYYISDLNLGFEFQDPHHYKTTWYTQSPLSFYQDNDDLKRKLLSERGCTLITVPCWWDETPESLMATIQTYRPDIHFKNKKSNNNNNNNNIEPISLRPPLDLFSEYSVPGIGELMLPSFPLQNYNAHLWWLSEKYDGVRACWSSSESNLYTRFGKLTSIPKIHFRRILNDISMDGEIWFGRGNFMQAQRVAAKEQIGFNSLEFFRFIVFDFPIFCLSFEDRFRKCLTLIDPLHPTTICASHIQCTNKVNIDQLTSIILNNGGEGSVVREPSSKYQHGRSDSILKIKIARDEEALVVDDSEDSILLQLPNNIVFKAELHQKCDSVPTIGDIVEYEYDYKSPNLETPIRPRITRVRLDLTWQHVISAFHDKSTHNKLVNQSIPIQATKPRGFWVTDDLSNSRKFFDDFAASLQRDPQLAASWYDVTVRDVIEKGGGSLLQHYGGSLIRALIDVYPNININERNFLVVPRNYWLEEENRREFFESFSSKYKFDPHNVDNWYAISNQDILDEKNGASVLKHYGGSLSKALSHLFPSLKISEDLFHNTRFKFWQDEENQRNFFLSFAKKKNINPFIADNWYRVSIDSILSHRGGYSVLKWHNMSLSQSLINSFPNIGIQDHLFSFSDNHWRSITNRRMYFESIAKQNNFDPLILDNWYSLPAAYLNEGNVLINKYYNGSYPKALMDTFPDLPFIDEKFKVP